MRGRRLSIQALALAALCAVLAGSPLGASSAQIWKHRTRGDREQGDLKGVSLTSDGTLTLGPALDRLADSADPYLWALARSSRGEVYAGGGNDGKVYRLGKDGRLNLFFDSPEIEVHALAVDAKDNLYVGTSPRGKIYRVSPAGKADEFFSPGETYIWSMVFDAKGNLFVGTGTTGKIYRVSPAGKGEVFLDTDETHIRALVREADGHLIAGTDGKGLILRIDQDGKSTVLAGAPLSEVTAIALDRDGKKIYFAAAGQGTRGGAPRPSPPQPARPAPSQPSPEEERPPGQPAPETAPQQPAPQQQPAAPTPPQGAGVESKILVVESDGYSREIWSGTGDLILSLAPDMEGNLIAGAGIEGKIYRVDPARGEATLLAKADSAQITALLPEPGGSILAACSNLAALYRLGGKVAAQGTFESAPFDARVFSTWGNLSWKGESPSGSSIGFQVRSGSTSDPDATWSDWSSVQSAREALVDRPRARYLQWRAVLKSSDGRTSPRLGEVDVSYLQHNLAPELKSVEVQMPGVVFQRPSRSSGASASPAEGGGGQGRAAGGERVPRHSPQQPRPQNEKDGRAVQWSASDPNGDELRYSVYYRGTDEKEWKLMEEDLTDPFFSWDSTSMADGTYVLKIVADDSPGNPPGAALSAQRVSDPFDIDNNPPRIGPIRATVSGGDARLEFEVADSFSNVGAVEYSVNAEEWRALPPVDGICDSPRESYKLELSRLAAGEYTVVVRAADAAGNSATDKAVFRVGGSR
jgi:sugar lactone lactonase YvrE